MTSIKEPVSLTGTIRGQDHEAHCVVTALKVTIPGTGISAYARFHVKSVSRRLPQGEYELSVRGQTFAIRHQGEYWLSAA